MSSQSNQPDSNRKRILKFLKKRKTIADLRTQPGLNIQQENLNSKFNLNCESAETTTSVNKNFQQSKLSFKSKPPAKTEENTPEINV